MESCRAVLSGIRDRLSAGERPAEVIASLLPDTLAEAEAWGRRLPLWAEFAGEFGPQAVGLARVVTKRGLRQFRRTLDRDGLIIPGTGYGDLYKPPTGEPVSFTLEVEGQPVSVVYTPGYARGSDHFQFTGPGDPPEPMTFTGTRHHSHFAPSDAVAAVGGPSAYARAFAEAGPGRDEQFKRVFEGESPAAEKPARGKHSAKAVGRKPGRVPAERQPARPPMRPAGEPDETPDLF